MSDSYETGEDDVYTADPRTLPTEMGGPWFNTTNTRTENNITVEEDNHIEECIEALELESSLLEPIKVEDYLEPVDNVDASNIKVINGEETYAAEAAEDQEKSGKPAPSSSRQRGSRRQDGQLYETVNRNGLYYQLLNQRTRNMISGDMEDFTRSRKTKK